MKLFNKHQSEQVKAPQVNYDSALEFLIGLSEEDFEKISHVAVIMRHTKKMECEILGVEDQPTTFINTGQRLVTAPAVVMPGSFLDDDEDDALFTAALTEEPEFIETPVPEIKTRKKRSAKKTAAKGTSK